MHPYLPYLLSDINAAHLTEVPEEIKTPLTFEEEMEELERWEEGVEPPHDFSYYCGLRAENFPPAIQFTKEEIELVNEAFSKMMFTYNLRISLPEKLPAELAYSLMVKTLHKKTDVPNSGVMVFDFCTGYAPDCIFKEYCPCLEIWNQEDDADDNMNPPPLTTGELPF